jgi:hypothetical protein
MENIDMWKLKLDDSVWLAECSSNSITTTDEKEAWLLPTIQAVQEVLEKMRKFKPYPHAMVVAEINQE